METPDQYLRTRVLLLNYTNFRYILSGLLVLGAVFPFLNEMLINNPKGSVYLGSWYRIMDTAFVLICLAYLVLSFIIKVPAGPNSPSLRYYLFLDSFVGLAITWAVVEAALETYVAGTGVFYLFTMGGLSLIPVLTNRRRLLWFGYGLVLYLLSLLLLGVLESLPPMIVSIVVVGTILGFMISFLRFASITKQSLYSRNLEEMSKEFEEMNRTLLETREKLVEQQKIAVIGRMAAGIVHEVNNPVGYIKSYLNSLNERISRIRREMESAIGGDQTEEIVRIVNNCREGLERIAEITQRLSTMTNPHQVPREPCDLRECLRTAHLLVAGSVGPEIRVRLRLNEIDRAFCNQGEILQVAVNLLTNAIQAVSDREEEGLIILETFQKESRVYFRVSDNGPGFPEGGELKIFEPFFTTKTGGKSMGLGLSISRQLVENNGDEIIAHRDTMTCFTVCLPGFRAPVQGQTAPTSLGAGQEGLFFRKVGD